MSMKKSFYVVVGLGKTGFSIARYLRRKNANFVFYDTRQSPDGLLQAHADFADVPVFLETFPESLLDEVSDIISSPGVDLDATFMQHARERRLPIYGDIECFAREIGDARVIAITGTNGKSTVTTLVGEMARASGLTVAVAGNIGTPVLDLLDDEASYALWVLELSSFQLDLTTSLMPLAATVLNVTPDHLDRHHSFQSYLDAKHHIFHHAKIIITNREDELTHPPADERMPTSEIISYGLDAPTEGQWGLLTAGSVTSLAYGSTVLLPLDALKIKGLHNGSNALAACALATAAGIPIESALNVLTQFTGLPHRTQWVRTLDGVDFINDSKGTNIGATCSAISGIGDAIQGKIVLIAGGQGKGADFTTLSAPIAKYVRSMVLIGEDADKMVLALGASVNLCRAKTLEDAIHMARQLATPGDVVMLSPACASLDMFRDFNHRGDVFVATVSAL